MKKLFYIIGIITSILLTIVILFGIFLYSTKPQNYRKRIQEIMQNYKIYSPPIPDTVYFAGERVPIENFDVREALDYELLKIMYWHSETILYLKRSKRIFPIVEPILKENGIPEDFKYLLVAESGMVNVTSPAGAKGYWQFMKKTALEYGLQIDNEVDERLNLEKSTQAACQFLKDSYKMFGNWTLAAASYNVGRDRLKKAIIIQGQNNFYDLLLNRETSRYIYRIIAFKIIFSNPQAYGFRLAKEDYYYPLKIKEIEIDSSINDLVKFAQKFGMNYKIFKMLNPWLISNKLTNPKRKKYKIKILLPQNRKIQL